MCKTEEQANLVKSYLGDYENMLRSRKIENVINIEAISICNSCDGHYNNQKNNRNFTIIIGLGIAWDKSRKSITSIKLPMFIIENYEDDGKQQNYCYQKNSKCTKDIMANKVLPVYKAFLKEKKFMFSRTLILLD